MKWAELIDAYRVVPRIILLAYAYLVFYVLTWFMGLENPSTQQAALVTTVSAIVAPVIGLYTNSGRDWQKENK